MRSTLLASGIVVCLAAVVALGQDPTKAEPKHYRLAFENDRVQVVSVHYGPHEKSGMHEHPGGVVVILTEAHLRFTDENGKTREIYSKPGEARWYPPFKHRVENLGDTAYDAVYVGLKGNVVTADGSAHPATAIDTAMDGDTKKLVTQLIAAMAKP
ncbi:MAG TPA: hypothetical protein VKA07_06705 [Candidatus Sulfotelmatobacter sp.]|nr:hypothetical protein [Candidatus Sulfotelmatobacter sp.]